MPLPSARKRGEVESVIVTLQDMTPLEELERLRAEFLGMVSHELRAPLASIKGSAATLTGSADQPWTRPRCSSSSGSLNSRPTR